MAWTMKDVKVIIKEVEIATGEKLPLEVKVNGRLKKALARCFTSIRNGVHVPTKLEFGRLILNVSDYEIFRQIVLHELGHAIANRRYQDNCNHDSRFKKVCQEIGCTNTGAYCSVEYSNALQQAYERMNKTTSKPKQETTKYHVVCKDCGHIHHYSRKCDAITNTENYRCAKCKSDRLYVEQNW